MAREQVISIHWQDLLSEKLRDYKQLIKFRLTTMVVFSTAVGFILASTGSFDWINLIVLLTGGFLIVASSNTINQIIERDSDKLMTRTSNRPLAQNRMSVTEAGIAATLMGLAGVILMGTYLNQLSAFLSFMGLIIYAFAYTPLKKITPVAVFVGAVSGAIPPMAGYVAVTGSIDLYAITLFAIQFVWQFPHFWAIAWVMDDDYRKAGIKLLPMGNNKDKVSALQIMTFNLLLIPLSVLPAKLGVMHVASSMAFLLVSTLFLYQAYRLYRKLDHKAALRLMFGSIMYLPLIFLILVLDKLIF